MMRKGKSGKNRMKGNNGFTLLEMIAVLVIMAIIMAVALSRGIATQEAKLLVEIDTLKSHLRYAQYLSLNENEGSVSTTGNIKWGISMGNSSSSYELVKYDNDVWAAHTSLLPNESSATHNFASGITAAWTGTVLLDDWGSPYLGSVKMTGGLPITPITIITFSPGSQSIKMYAETGFIP